MRVLVTGHRGYIGSVLTSLLQRAHYEVVGVDCDWYAGCDFGRIRENVPSFDTDLRNLEFADLLSFDAVVHLAATPEDFSDRLSPQATHDINVGATIRLADLCRQARVERFLFASTCAVYGVPGPSVVDEESPVAPLTAYARAKLQCEQGLAKLADSDFCPVFLRLATAYGVSPRMRLDTVVNEFTASALTLGRIDARTSGQAWRPLVHVEDMGRTMIELLEAPADAVAAQVFNVAATEANYKVIDVADLVCHLISHATYTMNREIPDARSYRVSGEKLRRTCPALNFRWTLERGIRQLRGALENAGLTPGELRSSRYRRLAHLCRMQEAGHLTPALQRPYEFSEQPACS